MKRFVQGTDRGPSMLFSECPVRPVTRVNFCRHHLNLLRVHWSAKHGPEFGKPIQHLPLIPADVLKKHHVHESLDTRFRSAARLLQALGREDRDLAIGIYVGEDGKRRKLGSRISEVAGQGGRNFLTPEIAHIARRDTAYREIGALRKSLVQRCGFMGVEIVLHQNDLFGVREVTVR
jgi:hypothetical protein